MVNRAQNAQAGGQAAHPGAIVEPGGLRLRPYQTAALEALSQARASGLNRLLYKSPTGTGKTVTFAAMLRWPALSAWLTMFPAHERTMLVIAHREELLVQAAEKIRAQNPGLMVDIEQADLHANRYSDVVIASIQTLAARKFTRLKRLLTRHRFRLVIVDEAHHAAATTYRTALAMLGFLPVDGKTGDRELDTEIEAASFDDVAVMEAALTQWDARAPQDRLLVGCTATPNRTDAIGLGCVFQTIAYSYDLRTAIEDRWLVPITPWVVESHTSLDDVRVSHGEFNQKDLSAAVNQNRRNTLAVAAWKEHADGLSTIAFTVDVAHAHALADAFRSAGVPAEALSGETPKEDRRTILERFRQGSLELIANCMVLTEGTDLPRTGCILHAKPTKSATLYEQMTGRGLRLHPGKTACVVIDVVDVSRKHSLQSAPVLYGLPPGLVATGQTLDVLEAGLETLRAAHPGWDLDAMLQRGALTLAQLQAKTSTFDVWDVQPLGAFGTGRALDWMKVRTDVFRLQYPWADGTETLQVSPDLIGKWEVVLTMRPRPPEGGPSHNARRYPGMAVPLAPVRQRTVACHLETADQAAGIAEAFVLQERRSVSRLKGKDAAWHGDPPTEKQLAALTRMRVPHNPKTLTKGEASHLLDLAIARKGRY